MGSTPDDIKYAIALCRKEPRGDDVCEKLFGNEIEAHEVTLSAFFIDRTEVTVGAYRRCVELGRCSAPPYASGATRFDRSDYPVTLVSWDDADEYCRFAGGRLPTEAEWERAARGAAGRRFPWGNVYNKSLANHGAFALDDTDDSDGFAELAPVGSFPLGRTPDGIDDMAGNVEEWVADALDDAAQYPKTSEVNPKGTGNGVFRIARGGGLQGPMAGIGAARRGCAVQRAASLTWRAIARRSGAFGACILWPTGYKAACALRIFPIFMSSLSPERCLFGSSTSERRATRTCAFGATTSTKARSSGPSPATCRARRSTTWSSRATSPISRSKPSSRRCEACSTTCCACRRARSRIVPGNHDVYTRGAQKKRRFSQYFEPYLTSDLPEPPPSSQAALFPSSSCADRRRSSACPPRSPACPSWPRGDSACTNSRRSKRSSLHPRSESATPVILLAPPALQPRHLDPNESAARGSRRRRAPARAARAALARPPAARAPAPTHPPQARHPRRPRRRGGSHQRVARAQQPGADGRLQPLRHRRRRTRSPRSSPTRTTKPRGDFRPAALRTRRRPRDRPRSAAASASAQFADARASRAQSPR